MGKRITDVCCILLYSAVSLYGGVYYVDSANGNDTGNGLTLSTSWETINKANQQVQPGDTVYIRKGTYSERITPGTSGTDKNRITYKNYNGERALVARTDRAIRMINRSYITIDGIDCEDVDFYVLLDSCHHIWIQNGTFDNAKTGTGWPVGVRLWKNSHHNRIHHCTLGRVGFVADEDDKGGVLNIGSLTDTLDHSHYNLIENNVFFYGGHHIITVSSSYNVIRNNYFHNEEWMDCDRPEANNKCGNRHIIFENYAPNVMWNIIENNRFAFSGLPPDQLTSSGFNLRTPHNIVRRNVFYYCDGPGMSVETYTSGQLDAKYNYVYHNVYYHNGHHIHPDAENRYECGLQIGKYGQGIPVTDVTVKNNIFYDNKTYAIEFYYTSPDSQVIEGNWEEAGDPLFKDITSQVDPLDPSVPDFQLQQASPCIDSGVFLTNVVSPDGSGMQFQVEDAGYFTNGWGIIKGDLIQLQGALQQVRVTQVDYNSNTITVDKTLAWTTNTGVSLAYEGKGPDIGAFEYGMSIDIKKSVMQNPFHAYHCSIKVIPGRNGVQIVCTINTTDNPEICIYDLSGRCMVSLPVNTKKGMSRIFWNGCDVQGNRCVPGCYIARLNNAEQEAKQSFVYIQ